MFKQKAIKDIVHRLNTFDIRHTSHALPYSYTLTFHKPYDDSYYGELVVNKYTNDPSGWITYIIGDVNKTWKVTGCELIFLEGLLSANYCRVTFK